MPILILMMKGTGGNPEENRQINPYIGFPSIIPPFYPTFWS
jgi:hypothetical protein